MLLWVKAQKRYDRMQLLMWMQQYSEKATNSGKISTVDVSNAVTVKSTIYCFYFIKYSFALVCKPNFAIKPADGATTVWIFGERHDILLYLKKDGLNSCLLFYVKHTIKEFWDDSELIS